MKQEFISNSPLETKNFAAGFAKNLKPGIILALYGDLGAGKTTFIQGLAAGLGYKGKVTSPTFIFIRPYEISKQKRKIKTLYHIDLYRVEKPSDLETIGAREFIFDTEAVAAIEWPEKIEKILPTKTIKINLESISETKRKITVSE
ncbi:MAG: tRNA (adenosine(37)-N6)-threonylcarbamoyltransferase complex ATPase subunit type 1 TsaE [bacterium]|nr:tRNA (adenosine(37)-N6)-threonylcarbamoyltransferase complex ATPase subunit type 1 TsaE [bacterium]